MDKDKTDSLPDNPSYKRVVDSEFQSVADIKAYLDNTYTADCVKKDFFDRLMQEDNPRYRDYEGKLYVNCEGEGHGYSVSYVLDTLKILRQEEGEIEVQIDTNCAGTMGESIFIIKKEGEHWLLDRTTDAAMNF